MNAKTRGHVSSRKVGGRREVPNSYRNRPRGQTRSGEVPPTQSERPPGGGNLSLNQKRGEDSEVGKHSRHEKEIFPEGGEKKKSQ